MKERDLLNWTIAVAERTGWKVYHVPAPMVADRGGQKFVPSRRGAGLPDLFLLHEDPPRLIIAELKGDRGSLTDEQREFLRLARDVADETQRLAHIAPQPGMRAVGVYAWTPADRDIIEQILKSKVLLP